MMRRASFLCLIVFVVVFSVAMTLASASQANSDAAAKTVWNGVYTDAQAARGKASYATSCLQCHGADLSGGSDPSGDAAGIALVGSTFWNGWGDENLGTLFSLMRSRMPLDAPGSLDQNVYLDILAFILQSNQFPSGSSALAADGLAGIRVAAKDGRPLPVKDFTLVRVVGCLSEVSRGKWVLINSSEPLKTRDPVAPKEARPSDAETASLGARTFALEDVYSNPSANIGHTMEVRGFLLTEGPTGDRLNITSLRSITPTCQK